MQLDSFSVEHNMNDLMQLRKQIAFGNIFFQMFEIAVMFFTKVY